MRVVHVMASAARGGGADHLVGLLPALQALDVSCSAVVGTDGPLAGALQARGIVACQIDLMRSRLRPRGVLQLTQAVRALGPQIIHYHGTRAAFFGALSRLREPTTPSVYTVHGLSYRKETSLPRQALFSAAELLACRAASDVVSVSRADLLDLRARGCLSGERGHYIPNAVDTARFRPSSRQAARTHVGLPQESFVVGTTARLVPQKAVHDLIDAVAVLPDVWLVILGDGPQADALRLRAAPAAHRVVFAGSRDDVAACLPAFDIFALSSRWEGEPIALLEAMACGLPCVATRTAGAVELLTAAGAGRLVAIGDVAALAAALGSLRDDADARAQYSAAGLRFVATRTYAEQAARTREVYRALLS